jgi:hypothetical protein
MKQTKTIPFDWEEYNSNRDKYKVVTRDGDEVTQLTKFDTIEEMCLRCIISGYIASYNIYGIHFYSGGISQYDLQLQYEEEVVESWVNLYRTNDGVLHTSNTIYCKDLAESNGKSRDNYIKTINLNDLV